MRTRSQKQAKLIGRIITYTILIAAAIVCLFPFIWMISTSFKETSDIYKNAAVIAASESDAGEFHRGMEGCRFWYVLPELSSRNIFGYDRDCIFFLSSSVWFCEI